MNHQIARLKSEKVLPSGTGLDPVSPPPHAPAIEHLVKRYDRESAFPIRFGGPGESSMNVTPLDSNSIGIRSPILTATFENFHGPFMFSRRGTGERHIKLGREFKKFIDRARDLLGKRRERRRGETHHSIRGVTGRELVDIEQAASVLPQGFHGGRWSLDTPGISDSLPIPTPLLNDLPEFRQYHGGGLR